MSKPKFSELFGEYFEKLDTSISNGIVEECNLNIDDRTLCIKISENEYICKEEVNNVKCYFIYTNKGNHTHTFALLNDICTGCEVLFEILFEKP